MENQKHIHIIRMSDARRVGSKRYFTGKPCKYGHVMERMSSTGDCIECLRIRSARSYPSRRNDELRKGAIRYWKNREDRIAKRAEWRARNPNYDREQYEKNRQERIEYTRRWHLANPNYAKDYYWKNRDIQLKKKKDYFINNPEMRRASEAKRRSKKQTGASPRDVREWARCMEKICVYCGSGCDSDYHIDHYIPLSKGGDHEIYNLRISCPSCNMSKGAKMPHDFISWI